MNRFYSNGKLLLTGEYLILDGALSLAIPTKFGQSLIVERIDKPKLIWKSINDQGVIWFEDIFLTEEIASVSSKPRNDVSKRIVQILKAARTLNPEFLSRSLEANTGFSITTILDFPKNWGLGSSSTLINNTAHWANIDAYKLLEATFGGSGYDIACAKHDSAITYQLQNESTIVNPIDFNPDFKEQLYFIYLNKKQDSRDAIVQYNSNKNNSSLAISEISDITSKIITSTSLGDFEALITSHEQIVSKIIKQKPVKELLFNDYKGAIKSLGAWGGDFILATGNTDSLNYFSQKGYHTIIPYTDMVLN